MSGYGNIRDYQDMEGLVKSSEWRVWIKFIVQRAEHLTEKVVRLVRERKYEEASGVVAVLDDIQRQLQLFKNNKDELETKLSNQNGGM